MRWGGSIERHPVRGVPVPVPHPTARVLPPQVVEGVPSVRDADDSARLAASPVVHLVEQEEQPPAAVQAGDFDQPIDELIVVGVARELGDGVPPDGELSERVDVVTATPLERLVAVARTVPAVADDRDRAAVEGQGGLEAERLLAAGLAQVLQGVAGVVLGRGRVRFSLS